MTLNTINDLLGGLAKVSSDAVIAISGPGLSYSIAAGDLFTALGGKYQPTVLYQVYATPVDGLNIRQQPGTNVNDTVLATVPQNTRLNVLAVQTDIVNGYHWLQVQTVPQAVINAPPQITGWCAEELTAIYSPPPPVIVRAAGALVGLHFLGNANLADYLSDGAPLAGATVLDNINGANYLIAAKVPYVILRLSPDEANAVIPDTPAQALAYGQSFLLDKVNAHPELVGFKGFLQVVNQQLWTPGHDSFWQGCMIAAAVKGIKLAIGGYGVGQPEPAQWSAMKTSLAMAKANGHIMSLHCYCQPGTPTNALSVDGPDYELRPLRLYSAVPPTSWPDLVISEAAREYTRGLYQGIDPTLSFVSLYTNALKSYPFVKAINFWTDGDLGGWASSDLHEALGPLANWVKANS